MNNTEVKQILSSLVKIDYIKIFINIILFTLSVLVLIQPAINNGFPILHSDSGSYIFIGFQDFIPVSRPISYCLFVRHISLWYSLWFVVITQAIIITGIILLIFHTVINTKYSLLYTFLTISFMSLTTGLPYYASQIMPDLFLSVSLLGLYTILSWKKMHPIILFLVAVFIIFANIAHLSNLPISTATISITIIILYFLRKKQFFCFQLQRVKCVVIILIISWLAIPTINYSYGIGFTYSRVKNIVMFSRLLHGGVVQEYVKDKCRSESDFFLCEYSEILPKYNRLDYFLWEDTSFLYKHNCYEKGWEECWIQRDDEFGEVVKEIRSNPKYLKLFIKNSFNEAFKQITTFNIIHFIPLGAKSHLRWPIQLYFKKDYDNYLSANQQAKGLDFPIQNKIQKITIVISAIFICFFFLLKRLRKKISVEIKTLTLIAIIAFLVNAIFIATFAVVVGRFQGRIIWLIPFIFILIVVNYFFQSVKEKSR